MTELLVVFLLVSDRLSGCLVDPPMQETSRDLSVLVVPQAGRVVATDDAWEPYRLVDADGVVVESVAAYLRDLQAAGRSAATARSYGLDLLRWFRFLWAVEVGWDRATRVEARDFCRWLQIAGKPARPHWRRRDEPAAPVLGPVAGWRRPYAASVRAHSETVLRGFYDFHLDAGTGPILNPFPLDRSRRGRPGARAPQSDGASTATSAAGLYRPTVPSRIPRSVPDEEFNEIFARLPSHRDRALVAFYVSTGARASELLSATQGGVDPGRQLITVVRKGTREIAGAAGVAGRVRVAAALPGGDGRADPAGRRQPLWWTLRRPARPLTYHAVHRMFERVNAAGRHARDAACVAPHRRLPDGRGPGSAADRRPVRPGPRPADHDADLPDAPQGGRGPPGAGPPRRADPAGGCAGRTRRGARLPARDAGRCCSGTGRRDHRRRAVTAVERDAAVITAARRRRRWCHARRTRPGSRRAHRAAGWPATSLDREQAFERLTGAPFVAGHRRQPEATPPRADGAAGLAGRPARPDLAGPVAGQRGRRRRRGMARHSRRSGCSADRPWSPARPARWRGVPVAICADLVRPHCAGWWPRCPAAGALVRGMAHARDA